MDNAKSRRRTPEHTAVVREDVAAPKMTKFAAKSARPHATMTKLALSARPGPGDLVDFKDRIVYNYTVRREERRHGSSSFVIFSVCQKPAVFSKSRWEKACLM